ncbi:MAG: hypothetical protein WC711_01345 [Candidatus Staskawiczbacteria bacterium]|jgi:predicted acetyltransferase
MKHYIISGIHRSRRDGCSFYHTIQCSSDRAARNLFKLYISQKKPKHATLKRNNKIIKRYIYKRAKLRCERVDQRPHWYILFIWQREGGKQIQKIRRFLAADDGAAKNHYRQLHNSGELCDEEFALYAKRMLAAVRFEEGRGYRILEGQHYC